MNKHALLDLYKQVPQVTEEVAIAVLDLYPTLLSLACAYSFLVSKFFPMIQTI